MVKLIQRAADGETALIKNMRIDHGRLDIGVPQKLLHGTNVVTGLEQMGGKAVAEGVWANAFGDTGQLASFVDGFLDTVFVQVMALSRAAARINGKPISGEDILPEPVTVGIWVFTLQGIRQVD